MSSWIPIALTVINLISLIGLVIFIREIKGVIRAQTHVIGEENIEVVYPPRLKVFLVVYVAIVLALAVFSYPVFWMSL